MQGINIMSLPPSSIQGLFLDAFSPTLCTGMFLIHMAQPQVTVLQEKARTRTKRVTLSITSKTKFRINFCKL